jgi:uncharacterized MAPEG superfamily protein
MALAPAGPDTAAMTLSHLTVAAVVLTFLMIMTASSFRTRLDPKLATGNRDALPPPTPAAERADRAAKNMLENLLLFVALVVAVGAQHPARAQLGAEVFVIARIVYWPIYLAGIPVVRTIVWTVGAVGLAILASAAL